MAGGCGPRSQGLWKRCNMPGRFVSVPARFAGLTGTDRTTSLSIRESNDVIVKLGGIGAVGKRSARRAVARAHARPRRDQPAGQEGAARRRRSAPAPSRPPSPIPGLPPSSPAAAFQANSFRFTPAPTSVNRSQSIRVAVRARAATPAGALRRAADASATPVTAITPTAYNLGVVGRLEALRAFRRRRPRQGRRRPRRPRGGGGRRQLFGQPLHRPRRGRRRPRPIATQPRIIAEDEQLYGRSRRLLPHRPQPRCHRRSPLQDPARPPRGARRRAPRQPGRLRRHRLPLLERLVAQGGPSIRARLLSATQDRSPPSRKYPASVRGLRRASIPPSAITGTVAALAGDQSRSGSRGPSGRRARDGSGSGRPATGRRDRAPDAFGRLQLPKIMDRGAPASRAPRRPWTAVGAASRPAGEEQHSRRRRATRRTCSNSVRRSARREAIVAEDHARAPAATAPAPPTGRSPWRSSVISQRRGRGWRRGMALPIAAAMTGASPAERLAEVEAAIARAARLAGRAPDEVTLIAVSKTHGADAIRPLIEAGQRDVRRESRPGGAGQMAGAQGGGVRTSGST